MEQRKKMDFPVGVKVRGYGIRNEFGEFEFIPENTGSRQGRKKLVKEGNGYSVSNTSAHVIIHLLVPKQDERLALIREYMKLVNNVLEVLRDYEI